MARKRISSSDLIWILHERLKEYDDHPFHGVSLAVVPESNGDWTVVTQSRLPKRDPDLKVRLRSLERKLRQEYRLAAE
jgi:hypothetical protein